MLSCVSEFFGTFHWHTLERADSKIRFSNSSNSSRSFLSSFSWFLYEFRSSPSFLDFGLQFEKILLCFKAFLKELANCFILVKFQL